VGGDQRGWHVENGDLVTDGHYGGGWLRLDREYGNFILHMDFMLSKVGNSGVLIRGMKPDSIQTEVQLLAPWTPHRDDLHCTASLYGHVAVNPRPDETPLRWYTLEIVCAGKTIITAVNGQVCCTANTDDVPSLKGAGLSGHIGLQSSHSEAAEWVRFRNIRIRDLDRDELWVSRQLSSPDPTLRRLAVDAAAALGPVVTGAALRTIATETPEGMRTGGELLDRLIADATKPGRQASARLLARRLVAGLRESTSAHATRAAIVRLGLVGGASEVGPLVAALNDPALADAAVAALARIPGRAADRALARAAASGPAAVRPAAALAIRYRERATS
jgi:hypothetical protein